MKEKFYKTEDRTDKGGEFEVVKKEELGRGQFGVAYSVAIETGKHKFPFVLKEYNNPVIAKDEQRKYLEAKEAGLKVFPTFRISEDETKVIMTTGHTKDWVCIGSNNENLGGSLESLGMKKIKSLDNGSFENLLKKYFEQADIASEKKFTVALDAPFFFVERDNTENVKLDFVLGDLGQVIKNPDMSEKDRNRRNVSGLRVALTDFIKANLENPRPYLDKINEVAKQKSAELEQRAKSVVY